MPLTDFLAGPDLLQRLAIEATGPATFRGLCGLGPGLHVFGGQIAAQAVLAAGRTVEQRWEIRSLHAYFLRPALAGVPIEYSVERLRDGRSAAVRSVIAEQSGERVFTLGASFQALEEHTHSQVDAPQVSGPEQFPVGMSTPVEVRPISWSGEPGQLAPRQQLWFRCPVTLPDDPLVHAAAATFSSDLTLGWSPWKALGIHRVSAQMYGASMDHAMWFHRGFRADSWLLLDQTRQAVAGGRGLAMAHTFDRDGRLIMTAVQEGLMRGIHDPTVSPPEMERDNGIFVIA